MFGDLVTLKRTRVMDGRSMEAILMAYARSSPATQTAPSPRAAPWTSRCASRCATRWGPSIATCESWKRRWRRRIWQVGMEGSRLGLGLGLGKLYSIIHYITVWIRWKLFGWMNGSGFGFGVLLSVWMRWLEGTGATWELWLWC